MSTRAKDIYEHGYDPEWTPRADSLHGAESTPAEMDAFKALLYDTAAGLVLKTVDYAIACRDLYPPYGLVRNVNKPHQNDKRYSEKQSRPKYEIVKAISPDLSNDYLFYTIQQGMDDTLAQAQDKMFWFWNWEIKNWDNQKRQHPYEALQTLVALHRENVPTTLDGQNAAEVMDDRYFLGRGKFDASTQMTHHPESSLRTIFERTTHRDDVLGLIKTQGDTIIHPLVSMHVRQFETMLKRIIPQHVYDSPTLFRADIYRHLYRKNKPAIGLQQEMYSEANKARVLHHHPFFDSTKPLGCPAGFQIEDQTAIQRLWDWQMSIFEQVIDQTRVDNLRQEHES